MEQSEVPRGALAPPGNHSQFPWKGCVTLAWRPLCRHGPIDPTALLAIGCYFLLREIEAAALR
eukprot:4612922-Amphidinium_carterae.1